MFFPELAAYNYYSTRPFPSVKAVGWLDNNHPFAIGVVPINTFEKLRSAMVGNEKVNIHVNPIRGIHPCNLCEADDFDNSELRIGSTEIWIPDGHGGFYASPSMIIHYITEHQYLPPSEFLNAVQEFDLHCEFNAQAEYEKIATKLMSS
ncbi:MULTISPECIES: hypothetical protein [Asticcacaulis]|uniref:DUF7919 family protein n=1 Tax=Asticcacaulis TaxID=76890 RepID=UPI001AE3E112|nr:MULTISPECIES: hypothetical protein [Asticcacaulis]MBP2161597.1 hypothetical protein [Asticcacaulis solisilvae]MDR6802642.1 hypothetical protein [Asticcacaulis sp. BE141]